MSQVLPKSLKPTDDHNIADVWRIEAESRLAEIECGEAQLLPATEVFENLHRQLA